VLADMAAARRANDLPRLLRHETILAVLTVIALIVLASLSDKFFTTRTC
jgi:hypothetical protein